MAGTVTLEQVETLATQLAPQDQLRLMAHLSEQLSASLPGAPPAMDPEELRRQRAKEADELLALMDAVAEMTPGDFDAVEDIRQMRAERDEQICPSKR